MADALEVDESVEVQGQEVEAQSEENTADSVETEPQTEKLVVTIGEQKPDEVVDEIEEEKEDDTPVIKKIRTAYRNKEKSERELRRELAEIKAKLNAQVPQVQEEQLPPEPSLDDEDVGYDTDKFKKKVFDWTEKKRKHDEAAAAREAEARKADERWKNKLASYQQARANSRFEDFQDAELEVQHLLNQVQQSIIVDGCKDPALVVYALGKNPAEAKRLAGITHPIEFAMEIARLEEKDIKVSKKPSVQPERRVSGSGAVASSDATLERLRAEADRTGDRTKVLQYLRDKRK